MIWRCPYFWKHPFGATVILKWLGWCGSLLGSDWKEPQNSQNPRNHNSQLKWPTPWLFVIMNSSLVSTSSRFDSDIFCLKDMCWDMAPIPIPSCIVTCIPPKKSGLKPANMVAVILSCSSPPKKKRRIPHNPQQEILSPPATVECVTSAGSWEPQIIPQKKNDDDHNHNNNNNNKNKELMFWQPKVAGTHLMATLSGKTC